MASWSNWDNGAIHNSPFSQVWDDFSTDASSYGSFEEEPCYMLSSQPLSRNTSSDGSPLFLMDSYPNSPMTKYPNSPMTNHNDSGDNSPVIDPVLFNNFDYVPDMSLAPGAPEMSQVYPIYDQNLFEMPPAATSYPTTLTSHCQSSTRDYPLICLFPNCDAKPFRRRADLERHYRNRHAPEPQRESYWCDYRRCARKTDPFHRRDHFRDHLRDFHREDIEKRGVVVSDDWYENRNTPPDWWRCNKCLQRIEVASHGFECPTCKCPCHEKRREVRQR